MNERDLRLLQAAAAAVVGSTVAETDDTPNASVAVEDDNMELVVADLSADEINAALQALVGEMEERHDDKSQDFQPPRPTCNTTTTNKFDFDTTEDSLSNLKRLLGLDDSPSSDTIDEVLRQHNGSVVASGMDQPPAIDHEGHLADLQRRANSPPTQEEPTVTEVDSQATANLVNWLSALVGPPSTSTSAPLIPTPTPPAQPRGRTRQSPIPDPFEDPTKTSERDRIRVENRERKKKWRTQNQERSKFPPLILAQLRSKFSSLHTTDKDNDLRCRVTKRAAQLYGTVISAEKTFWVEREFNRRRYKRVTRKEQRIIDNPASNNPSAGSSSVFPAFNSSPPPEFSPVVADTGSVMSSEDVQPGGDVVEVMHALAALSGEPSMFATLVGVAVANGYDEQALQAHYDRLTPGGSASDEEDGGENRDFTKTTENTATLSGTWAPEVSATPASCNTLREPQQAFVRTEDLEKINHVEVGFEALVASLESGLKEHRENSVSEENNEDQGVKSEPVSPNQLPVDHWTSAQTLGGLVFDDLPEESLDSAIAELLKSQSERHGGVTEEGEVEFNDEDIQRLLAEGGEDVEMLLSSMEADEIAAVAEATQIQGVNECVENFTTGNGDRVDLTRQAGRTSDLALEGGESAGFTIDADDLPIADGMTLEEINSLLADLGGGGDPGPIQLDTPVSQPQQRAASPRTHVPALASPSYNPDPDTSALYTKDTIVAIFKAILDLSPNPPPLPKRGIKRSSPGTYENDSPIKRHCSYIPANTNMNTVTISALNQLSGILGSTAFMQHSPPATQVKTQAYVASFGTADGMNKRLVAMKPPPYRLNGSGANGCGVGIGVTGVQSKRKTGDEEKKVRAMGFPPLMAGMGRKA